MHLRSRREGNTPIRRRIADYFELAFDVGIRGSVLDEKLGLLKVFKRLKWPPRGTLGAGLVRDVVRIFDVSSLGCARAGIAGGCSLRPRPAIDNGRHDERSLVRVWVRDHKRFPWLQRKRIGIERDMLVA